MTSRKPTTDTPEALGRVLAMYMAVQGDADPAARKAIDDSELRLLEDLDAFKRLGLTKAQFLRLVDDARDGSCCEFSRHDWLHNDDLELIDGALDAVQDRRNRLLLCRYAQCLVTADGRVDEFERQLYDHMLLHWGHTRSSVTQAILEEHLG